MGSEDAVSEIPVNEEQKAKSVREPEAVPPPPRAVSGASIEDLVADRTATRLGRLELWLLDATETEMEDLWESLKDAEGVTYRDMDALFIRWTALNPGRAIAAAEGTTWAHIPWWGWARSEPEKAIATAMRERPERIDMIMRSIGQSRPELALRLIEQHPEELAGRGVTGITYGLAQSDPQRAVEFARRNGSSGSDQMETWATREPDAMFDWLERNEAGFDASNGAKQGIKMAAREHPERIAEFVERLRPGALQQEMMREGIAVLVTRDVDAAFALVERSHGLASEAEWYGVLGAALSQEDIERSMQLFEERVALGSPGGGEVIHHDNMSFSNDGSGVYQRWASNLAETYPEEVIEQVRQLDGNLETAIVGDWMQRDPDGLGNWLQSEPIGPERDRHIESFARHLADGEIRDYAAALNWYSEVSDGVRRTEGIRNVVVRLMNAQADPAGAALLRSGELPAEVMDIYREQLERRPNVGELAP